MHSGGAKSHSHWKKGWREGVWAGAMGGDAMGGGATLTPCFVVVRPQP